MIQAGGLPPRSPYGLLQEDCVPDEWRVLVVCMMLNCTTRKQVEKVLPEFIKRWPGPREMLACSREELIDVIRPLGFANRRASSLLKMTRHYLAGPWHHAKELPGIGIYAARAWEMFCRDITGDEPPVDHALVRVYHWRKLHEQRKEDPG